MFLSPNRKYIYLLLWCMLLSCCVKLADAQRVNFHNFGQRNGLTNGEVNCLLQDTRGYLWIGTKNGLSRYDGVAFENYTTRNGLPSSVINAIQEGKDGHLWIATAKGLCSFDGQYFSAAPLFTTNGTAGDNDVRSISLDTGNKIWLLTAAGILHFIEGKKSGYLKMPDTGIAATAFLSTGAELTIAATNGFMYSYDTKQKKWSTHITELISNNNVEVRSISRAADNRIWFATSAGLFVKKGDSAIRYRLRSGQELSAASYSITEDVFHNYWLGTAYGVIRFNDSSLQNFSEYNGFTDAAVRAVLTDKEGNIWLGTDGAGLFRFSGSIFSVFDKSTGLPGNQITAIAATRNGMMYMGSSDAGFFEYRSGVSGELAFPAGIKPVVSAIAVKNGYQVWIGTKGNGLWRYDYRGFKSYIGPTPTLPSNNVNHILADSRGRLWIAYDQGLVLNERDTFRRTGIRNIAVLAIYELAPDSILFATAQGLKIARDSSYYPYTTGGAVDSLPVKCFARKGNELWMGTASGVLMYNLSTQVTKIVTKADGLLSDNIVSLAADKEGAIWAGTDVGLHKITVNETGGLLILPFGEKQGIMAAASNPNAVWTMYDGSLWFGTENGVLHYMPGAKLVQAMPVGIVLQKVLLYGQDIKDTTYFSSFNKWQNVPYNLHLPAGKNNISFRFQGISLNGSGSLKYRYQLVGIDGPWSAWSSEQSVAFPSLPAGNYTLVVQCTADGKEIKELRYEFSIATPYMETVWFKAALIALFVLAGMLVQFLYSRRKAVQRKQALEHRHKVLTAIRERTSDDYHKITGDKIKEIHAAANYLNETTDIDIAKNIALQIKQNADTLSDNTDDMLWLMKPGNNNLDLIIQHIAEPGKNMLAIRHISFELESTDRRLKNLALPIDVSLNLLMIFKEAFLNISKHSEATAVVLIVTLKNRRVLQLRLNDNGKGFDMQFIRNRNGLSIMETRAAAIGARLYIDAMPDRGTIITLTFRIPDEV